MPDFEGLKRRWKDLAPYELFEQITSRIVMFFISIVIVYSLILMGIELSEQLGLGLTFIENESLRDVFGSILTILILIEFNHSIAVALSKKSGILQARPIVLITILVIARKVILLDFNTATFAVRRVKRGTPATHPIRGDEMRALRRLQREQEPATPFVFSSERRSPFTTAGFARMVGRAGEVAQLGFKAHPHMLRHACGFKLANDGHDTRSLQAYLGHKNIQHTVRYTELSPARFKDFWRD